MKRKFALLTILGALAALAIPAMSSASMFPAGHKFEIVGAATGPKLTTSLGSCTVSKINGTIPTAPTNETSGSWPGASITAGTCGAGTSITVSGSWTFGLGNNTVVMVFLPQAAEAIVMRFTSLPGCKLAGSPNLVGLWSNGVTSPVLMKTGFHAHSGGSLTWANDGGSCALAGKTEALSFEDQGTPPPNYGPIVNQVNDLTNPATLITVGSNK